MMKVLLTLRSNWIADELESGRMEKFEVMVKSQKKLAPSAAGHFEISGKRKENLKGFKNSCLHSCGTIFEKKLYPLYG